MKYKVWKLRRWFFSDDQDIVLPEGAVIVRYAVLDHPPCPTVLKEDDKAGVYITFLVTEPSEPISEPVG